MTTALGRHVPVGEVLGLPGALVYLVYGTGLFLLTEEAGWRGAVLPRLQHRMRPWQAALVLGVIWAGWHLPLLATPDAGDRGLPVAPFLLLVVATSVLVSGLVNAANGSVVVAALFHASFDASYSYLGVVGSEHTMIWAAAATTALAAIVLAGPHPWTSLPHLTLIVTSNDHRVRVCGVSATVPRSLARTPGRTVRPQSAGLSGARPGSRCGGSTAARTGCGPLGRRSPAMIAAER